MRLLKLTMLMIAIFLLSAISWAGTAWAQDVNDFKIISFEADYYLNRTADKTATLKTVEKIVAEFPDSDQNHGILRAIPKTYQGHTLNLHIDGVTNASGQPLNYTTNTDNNNLVLKIGDAGRYVHGQQVYQVTYIQRNVALLLPGHDELYWDVNGDQWSQSFDTVTTRIHLPSELAANLQDRQVCFAGSFGSSIENCTIERQAGESETLVNVKTKASLNPHETLTFTLGFTDGTFELGPEIAHEQWVRKIQHALYAAAIIIPPSVAFLIMYRRWRAFGDDPKGRGVIVAEYEPPKGFTTLSSDFLLGQKLRSSAFSAALIELAVKGYLTIYEIAKKGLFGKPDYQLELNKLPVDLPGELQKTVEMVFAPLVPGTKVKISAIKKSTTMQRAIYENMSKLEDYLSADLAKRGFFVKDPKKVKKRYLIWASVLLGFGFLGLVIFPLWAAGLGLMTSGVIMFIFGRIMPARTQSGVQLHDSLLGLKDYIKLAEVDRLKFGQSPEGAQKIANGSFDPGDPKAKIKLFEALLPYAMLFGLEKQWAKQFENIYKNPPDWYHGNWTTFNTAYLASSVGGLSSASATTFSAPSSSSGSGFSGGSSGGGGGGGGGGGW